MRGGMAGRGAEDRTGPVRHDAQHENLMWGGTQQKKSENSMFECLDAGKDQNPIVFNVVLSGTFEI
jgi:hypothetical protein